LGRISIRQFVMSYGSGMALNSLLETGSDYSHRVIHRHTASSE
jgi:hypothetical protein